MRCHKPNLLLVSIIAVYLVVGAKSWAVEELKIWLGTSVVQGIFKGQTKAFEEKTKIKLVAPKEGVKNNANLMLKDVLEGKAEAAVTSALYADWVSSAKKEYGLTDDKIHELTYRVIGGDNLTVVTHKDAGVSALNSQQIEDILSGKLRNWKQVGGKDQPIVVLLAHKATTNEYLKVHLLKGAEFVNPPTDINNWSLYIQKLTSTPGSFGFTAAGIDTTGTQVIKTPTIGRPITLITLGKPSARVMTFVDYIQKLGR